MRTDFTRIFTAFSVGAIICVLTIPFGVSCRKRSDGLWADRTDSISQILASGNLAGAIEAADRMKSDGVKSGDSMLWATGMMQEGINCYYSGNPDDLLAKSDTLLQWLGTRPKTTAVSSLTSKACQLRGSYYDQYCFNPDSMLYYFRKSVGYAESAGNPANLSQAFANYANTLRTASHLDSAAIYYHRAIEIADSMRLPVGAYIPLYNGIAQVFTDMRDFDNSRVWWEKSAQLLAEMGPYDRFSTLTGSGNELYYRKDYEGAVKLFSGMKDWLDTVPEMEWERMFTAVNLSDADLRTGRTQRADTLLRESERYFSEVQPNPVVISHIHTLSIRSAILKGNFREASSMAGEHPVSDTMRLEQLLARLEVLEDLSGAKGDDDVAYAIRRRRDNIQDSLRSFRTKQQISSLNALYSRDKRILTLERENASSQARNYRLLTFLGIAIAIGLGGVVAFLSVRGKQRRREEKMMDKIIGLRRENLRNRVTPHFIYNALNHEINNSQTGKPSDLGALVRLIRRQQYAASEITTSLGSEISFVEDYIRIMSASLNGVFGFKLSVSDGLNIDEIAFPSLALQILVENAFKHGFPTLPESKERLLEIKVECKGTAGITVSVFNNRGEIESNADKGGIGMKVLMETIRIFNELNKTKLTFTINMSAEQDGETGCRAIVNLPEPLCRFPKKARKQEL